MRALENPPEEDQILDPFKQTGKQTVHIPSVGQFRSERKYWEEQLKLADNAGDLAGYELSDHTKEALGVVIRNRVLLAEYNLLPPPLISGAREVQDASMRWYIDAVGVMTYSALCRVMSEAGKLALGLVSRGVSLDMDISNLNKGGLHFKRGYAEEVDLQWPVANSVTYYDAGSIYLAVSTPAMPTDTLPEVYSNFHREQFNPGEFATARPIFKQTAWQEEVA